jgi:hypothetical protein
MIRRSQMRSSFFVFAHPQAFATSLVTTLLLTACPANASYVQQGTKLVGTGAVGIAQQGISVALSGDGNTVVLGGNADNNAAGAAWAYTRSAGVWSQQGTKLVGTGAGGVAEQGFSIALSADGNTAVVGGPGDNGGAGAAWAYMRSSGVWSQQGLKLVGTGAVGSAEQGWSVALSADGNTAIVGGDADIGYATTGAAWVYTRSAGVWSQQGTKLVGSDALGAAEQGRSVALSADGNTAVVGGPSDNSDAGAAWVYTRSGGVWSQQGSKLVGTGALGAAEQGFSVALSADGNTAIVGGYDDNAPVGAAWVFTRSAGVWSQQGTKLVGTGAVGGARQGFSVALSADGNSAVVGGYADNGTAGAAWVYTRSGGVWSQLGAKLVGTGAAGSAFQGFSVALSADANTVVVGGFADKSSAGAAWVFVADPPLDVPAEGTVALALDRLPNPSYRGRLNVAFSLPSGERAMLEVMDVSGRRVAAREVGSLGAGRHTIDLGAEHRLPTGVYFVRLVQGSRVATARMVMIE